MNDEIKELSKYIIKSYQEDKINKNITLSQIINNKINNLIEKIANKYKIKLNDIKKIQEIMEEITKQCFTQKLTGYGYWVDKEMKTNEQVFSIFGKINIFLNIRFSYW
jgi:hypothetical protein